MNNLAASYNTHEIQPTVVYIRNKNLYRYSITLIPFNPTLSQIYLFFNNTSEYFLDDIHSRLNGFSELTGFKLNKFVKYIEHDETTNNQPSSMSTVEYQLIEYSQMFEDGNMSDILDTEKLILNSILECMWLKDKHGQWVGYIDEYDSDILIDLYKTKIPVYVVDNEENILINTKGELHDI